MGSSILNPLLGFRNTLLPTRILPTIPTWMSKMGLEVSEVLDFVRYKDVQNDLEFGGINE